MKKCTIAGCGNKHLANGLCRPHYDQRRRESPLHREKCKAANRSNYAEYHRTPGGRIDWRIRAEVAETRITELETLLERNKMRVEKLGELLATPVRFPDCDVEAVSIMAHWYTDNQVVAWVAGVAHAKNQIRAAGFKVEGDE